MSDDTRTMRQLAEEALAVQDACNLSGVVHGWSRSVSRLRVLLAFQGVTDTDAVNRHPVNVLFANKLSQLANNYECLCPDCWAKFTPAYDACSDLAKDEVTQPCT